MSEVKREAMLIQLMRDVCEEVGLPEEKGERAPILEALNVAYNKGAEQSALTSAQGEGVTLRASVRWFAEQMELALRRNDHKGGWHECSRHSLLARVLEDAAELVDSIAPEPENIPDFACAARNARFAANMVAGCGYFMSTTSVADTIREAADVGAIAMMVAEHFREGGPSLDQGQTLPPPPKAEGKP